MTNFRGHMKQSIVLSKTIKIALIPMIKTITASNLPQNPQKTKLADLKCTSGKWLFYIFRYAQLQNILQKIRFAHLAKIFASNSLRSFGKRSHFQGPILHILLCTTFAKSFKCSLRSLFTNKLTLFYFGFYGRLDAVILIVVGQ